ncbi:CoxG family protein [Devosia albogilva]|uniref:CoxG family protein n=1 Tax=Devosia albogilva TaxID=429726 RepID=A0ABW5QL58_9HYPH
MEFGGRYRIVAPRQLVWSALNDAAVLKEAIPGCDSINWVSEDTLELRIKVNLGVVHPTFTGELVLSDVTPAERYTLTGRGRGGLLGKAEAAADIALSDLGNDTLLVFLAHGGASGQIMKLGKGLIGNSAQRVIDGFFERFGTAMGAGVVPLPAPDSAADGNVPEI